MVARGGEGIWKLAENILVVVMNLARFAVEKLRDADDFGAERSADGLMAKANTKNRKFSGEALHQLHGNACFLRCAGPGGNHDAVQLAAYYFIDSDYIDALD